MEVIEKGLNFEYLKTLTVGDILKITEQEIEEWQD